MHKSLKNTFTAAALLGTAVCSATAEASTPTQTYYDPPIPTETEVGCTLYTNILNKVDEWHLNGATTMSHKDLAQAAYQNMLQNVYWKNFYDKEKKQFNNEGVTFKDPAKKKEVTSLTLNGKMIKLEAPSVPLQGYADHCNYLQAGIEELAAQTDTTIPKLYEYAINGALRASRDPYTRYVGTEKTKSMLESRQGQYVGIGIEIPREDGFVTIIHVIEGSPAEKAGLKDGDTITKINGKSLSGMDYNDSVKLMKGEAGTKAVLTIMRGDQEPFDVEVIRGAVKRKAVKGKFIGPHKDTAHITIRSFESETTTDDFITSFRTLIKEAIDKKYPFQNIIIDLRNNPGGLVSKTRQITDLLLHNEGSKKDPMYAMGKTPNDNITYVDTVMKGDIRASRFIVLQNQSSASGSEMLAGALKDDGVEIIGTRSYGKGSKQSVIPITKDGNYTVRKKKGTDINGILKVTDAAFFPGKSGLSNQGSGVIPTTKVVYNDMRDEIAEKSRRESDNKNTLLSTEQTRAGIKPERVCTLKEEFAGALSAENIKTIPKDMHIKYSIKNKETKKFEIKEFLDADMACAMSSLHGTSPYVTTAKFVDTPKPAKTEPAPDIS